MSAEEEKPDDLTEAYRGVSAEEAGRPGDATRRAILDEANAAARRRQPVANDARYVMRAVAGVAVFGVAVVLWRQMDHHLPGEAVSTQTAPAARLDMPIPEAQPAISAPAMKAEPPPAVPAAPAAPASPAPERQRAQSVSAAKDVAQESRADAASENAAGAASGQLKRAESMAAPQIADSDAALLIRYFPQQYNSDMPHSVWLVRNASGAVLQSGEITSGRSLEDLAPQIQQQLGGRKPGIWREQILLNARGQQIRLMTTTLP
jgi:hypothetical protein